MNHRQVGEERPEVWNCSVADESILLLKHLLQVAIILTGSVGKLLKATARKIN